MEDEHREAIRRNISSLVNQTDLEVMRSALYEKGIFTEHNMETYNDTSSTPMHRKRCMYNDIMRRGPRAFDILLETLEENGYWDLVRMLDPNSILNTFGTATTRPNTIEKEKENFLSISKKKSEHEHLNSHPAAANGLGTVAATNNNPEVPFVVKKSEKFVDDNQSSDIGLYRTRGKRRGVLLVFTYISFQNNIAKHRRGADVDSHNLKYLFSEIGFKVLLYQNLDLKETQNTLDNLRNVLEPAPESVFIVISSHGYERRGSYDTDIRCSDGKLISLLEIISYFSNRRLPRLRDVPKVFIFQICRGDNEDFVHSAECAPPPRLEEPAETDGATPWAEARAPEPHAPSAAGDKKMALYTNILLVQSTLPGFVSHRDPSRGSWYIQALCEMFAARAHDCHVDKLFTLVDERLKERFEIQTSSVDRWGFNRRLYLHPGLAE